MSPGNGCCLGNGEVVAVDSDDGGRLGGVSGGIVKKLIGHVRWHALEKSRRLSLLKILLGFWLPCHFSGGGGGSGSDTGGEGWQWRPLWGGRRVVRKKNCDSEKGKIGKSS